jgi:hypothetical protein
VLFGGTIRKLTFRTVPTTVITVATTVMALAGLAHVNLGDGSVLTGLFDAVAQFVQSLLTNCASRRYRQWKSRPLQKAKIEKRGKNF